MFGFVLNKLLKINPDDEKINPKIDRKILR